MKDSHSSGAQHRQPRLHDRWIEGRRAQTRQVRQRAVKSSSVTDLQLRHLPLLLSEAGLHFGSTLGTRILSGLLRGTGATRGAAGCSCSCFRMPRGLRPLMGRRRPLCVPLRRGLTRAHVAWGLAAWVRCVCVDKGRSPVSNAVPLGDASAAEWSNQSRPHGPSPSITETEYEHQMLSPFSQPPRCCVLSHH